MQYEISPPKKFNLVVVVKAEESHPWILGTIFHSQFFQSMKQNKLWKLLINLALQRLQSHTWLIWGMFGSTLKELRAFPLTLTKVKKALNITKVKKQSDKIWAVIQSFNTWKHDVIFPWNVFIRLIVKRWRMNC